MNDGASNTFDSQLPDVDFRQLSRQESHEQKTRANLWSVPHIVHSPQELAMASGVGRLTTSDLTIGAAQLQGVPSHPCGFRGPLTCACST